MGKHELRWALPRTTRESPTQNRSRSYRSPNRCGNNAGSEKHSRSRDSPHQSASHEQWSREPLVMFGGPTATLCRIRELEFHPRCPVQPRARTVVAEGGPHCQPRHLPTRFGETGVSGPSRPHGQPGARWTATPPDLSPASLFGNEESRSRPATPLGQAGPQPSVPHNSADPRAASLM